MGEILKRLRRRGRHEAGDALKRLDEQSERGPEAFQRFVEATRRLIAVPKDALLIELGQLYERSGSPADAKATYQRLITDYPASLYLSDAQSRIGAL